MAVYKINESPFPDRQTDFYYKDRPERLVDSEYLYSYKGYPIILKDDGYYTYLHGKYSVSRNSSEEVEAFIDANEAVSKSSNLKESYEDEPTSVDLSNKIDQVLYDLFDNLGSDPDVIRQYSDYSTISDLIAKLIKKYRAYNMPQDRDEYLDAISAAEQWRSEVFDLAIDKYGLDPNGGTWDDPNLDYKGLFNEIRKMGQEEVNRYGYDEIPTEIIREFGL